VRKNKQTNKQTNKQNTRKVEIDGQTPHFSSPVLTCGFDAAQFGLLFGVGVIGVRPDARHTSRTRHFEAAAAAATGTATAKAPPAASTVEASTTAAAAAAKAVAAHAGHAGAAVGVLDLHRGGDGLDGGARPVAHARVDLVAAQGVRRARELQARLDVRKVLARHVAAEVGGALHGHLLDHQQDFPLHVVVAVRQPPHQKVDNLMLMGGGNKRKRKRVRERDLVGDGTEPVVRGQGTTTVLKRESMRGRTFPLAS
jgi:hypothetical protein